MVLCRKPVDGGREEVLLDLNELAEHSGFVHVAAEIYRCVCRPADRPCFVCIALTLLLADCTPCGWMAAVMETPWRFCVTWRGSRHSMCM